VNWDITNFEAKAQGAKLRHGYLFLDDKQEWEDANEAEG
jgi:hypothetical protein